MAATEIHNEKNTAVMEREVQEVNDTVAQQVFEILEEDAQLDLARQPAKPAMVYRVPSPGVRYYF